MNITSVVLQDKPFLSNGKTCHFVHQVSLIDCQQLLADSTVLQWNRILLEDATLLTDAWGRPSMSEAYCVEVRDVFPQIICLTAVQAHLLAARLQHGIARDVPLQNVLGMAPANIIRRFKDCLASAVLAHCARLLAYFAQLLRCVQTSPCQPVPRTSDDL